MNFYNNLEPIFFLRIGILCFLKFFGMKTTNIYLYQIDEIKGFTIKDLQ